MSVSQSAALRRLGWLLGAGLAILLALHAAGQAWADLDFVAARKLLARWERTAEQAGAEYWWQQGSRLLDSARALSPLNGDYGFEQGLWTERRAERSAARTAESLEQRKQAAGWFEETLGLRPVWAHAWSRLAVNRFLGEGLDAGARAALALSLQLGPQEPEVLRAAAWISMQSWGELTPKLQQRAWAAIRRGARMRGVRGDLVRWAKQFGWSRYLEPALAQGQGPKAGAQ